MKLLIAGGGTGGHVSPGLAVAAAWQQRHGKGSVAWIGRQGGIEERMSRGAGLPFEALEALPFKRSFDLQNLKLPLAILRGFGQAWKILERRQASVLLVTGGYVSAPAALAAVFFGLPLVLLEPNAVLGISNQIFATAAGAICMAYAPKRQRRNMVLTGNPVRLKGRLPGKAEARRRFKLGQREPLLLVIPGSGAAHSINVALSAALKELKGLQILWMSGPKDFEMVKNEAAKSKVKCQVLPFIEDVASAYAAADLVLARSGASILAEIAQAAKASLLVPYPFATGDHQRKNAATFEEAGAARLLSDSELSPKRLAQEIQALLGNPERLKRMAQAARKLARADAADNVVGVLQRVAKGFNYV